MLRTLGLAALFASFLLTSTSALAQVSEEGDDRPAGGDEELPPGHPGRSGSYSWEGGGEVGPGGSTPAQHRFARIFLSAGAGLTIRTLIYVDTLHHGADGLAPPYLQLRGVFFFEGDGDFQHGIGLGISTNLTGEGLLGNAPDGTPNGLDAFAAWTFVPGYHLRVWLDDWFQILARVGFGVTAAELPNAGFEVGLGAVVKFLAGLGLYVEAAFSTYFSADAHPLISVEGGLVVDYELLP